MTNFIKSMLITFTIFPLFVLANSSSDDTTQTEPKTSTLATFFTLKDMSEKYSTSLEAKLRSIGFKILHPQENYAKEKGGESQLDIVRFISIVKEHTLLPLLNSNPHLAGFAPFTLLVYKKKSEKVTHIGHLSPEIMLDILHIKNPEIRKKFTVDFYGLDAIIAQELGATHTDIHYKHLPKKTMIHYKYTFETAEKLHTFIDIFQKKFLHAFTDKGYLISKYHDFMKASPDAQKTLSGYSVFGTYSLFHLTHSYPLFDAQDAQPKVAIFVPSTLYMYIKKDTHTLVIGMPKAQNWSTLFNITNEKQISQIKKIDQEIATILEGLGMASVENTHAPEHTDKQSNKITHHPKQTQNLNKKEQKVSQKPNPHHPKTQIIKVGNKIVKITIPAVPIVPKAMTADTIKGSTNTRKRGSITFSKRVPPNYIPHRFDKSQETKVSTQSKIGDVDKGKISAYLRGEFIEVDALITKLNSAGFKVIAKSALNKESSLISVVFTDDNLIAMANKSHRGFMASIRALVDTKEKTLSITNPLYLEKGFLQDDFDETNAKKVLEKLVKTFPKLSNSKDSLKYQLLPKYQFMNGMPKYQDMIEVASGKNLLEKVKDNKNVVFIQTLSGGATLVGIKLSKRTRKFIDKIGRNNAAMLPYPILIENDKAMILDPKYYISFMYPKLTMSEFMTIATIPDAMIKDCEKVFK